MVSVETENGLEYNLTIALPSNTSHKSLSIQLLASRIYSNSLTKLYNSLIEVVDLQKNCLTVCLPTLIDPPPKLMGM